MNDLKALAILRSLGRADEWDRLNDYYVETTPDGAEFLRLDGDDEPLAGNRTTTSWASPGYPVLSE
jgi:hypothetical protein